MPTVFTSVTGARAAIASDDHCPPHVHALHRGEGWLVRVEFSYVSTRAGVISIEPSTRAVRQRQLNQLLDDVEAHLAACRRVWWNIRGTTCLPNKWMMVHGNTVRVLDERQPDARRVKTVLYDSSADTTRVVFWVGSDVVIPKDSGEPM
jgi:hypothetical protein